MVSRRPKRTRPAPTPVPAGSRDRLLAAAALEFAARGFDGAKVDRIAAHAHVNKAMLYYHFEDKAALYRDILQAQFGALARTLVADRTPEASPQDQVRWFIRTVAAALAARPHFPAIWLREMAEGGRHLQPDTIAAMSTIVGVLADILRGGARAGAFREVHPFITQLGIVGPLLMFAASAPIRARLGPTLPAGLPALLSPPDDAVLRQVEAATLAAIAVSPPAAPDARSSSSRSSSAKSSPAKSSRSRRS